MSSPLEVLKPPCPRLDFSTTLFSSNRIGMESQRSIARRSPQATPPAVDPWSGQHPRFPSREGRLSRLAFSSARLTLVHRCEPIPKAERIDREHILAISPR